MTESKKTPQQNATWADVLKGFAALVAVAFFVQIGLHDDTKIQEMQKNYNTKKTLDSLVKDSLSKTIEYQNAVDATKIKEQKENEIRQYFDSIQKSHSKE